MTTPTNTEFNFGDAAKSTEAYHPGTAEVLPKGNYLVTVTDVENTTSSGSYPMLKLTVENDQGRQWDNLVISPNEFSVQKLMGLIDSAGLSRPDATKGEIDPSNGRLSDAYAYQLRNKQVGVIVRDEEDNRPDHFGEVRPRVKGYVDPEVLTAATTGPLGGSTATTSTPQNGTDQSDLAF
jgi:hypothetical protein